MANWDYSPKQKAKIAAAKGPEKTRLRELYNQQHRDSQSWAKPSTKAPPAPQNNRKKPAPKRGNNNVVKFQCPPKGLHHAFNAFDKRHMPLDEHTSPYTVSNFSSILEFPSSSVINQIIVVGMRMYHGASGTYDREARKMTDVCAILYNADGNWLTGGGPVPPLQVLHTPILGGGDQGAPVGTTDTFIRARIHNLSASLQCAGASSGLYPVGRVYYGTVPSIEMAITAQGPGDPSLKSAWADNPISVGLLKPTTAAALLHKPVTLHATPAEAVVYKEWRDMIIPVAGYEYSSNDITHGLEPMIFYIPKTSGDVSVQYTLTVGQQWCTRHPQEPILRATMKQHTATEPAEYSRAVATAKRVGTQLAGRVASGALNMLEETLAA